MRKSAKLALTAMFIAGAIGAAAAPAYARVYIDVGPGAYAGPYGPYWNGCYYGDPYDCAPAYYDDYYGPTFGFGWGGWGGDHWHHGHGFHGGGFHGGGRHGGGHHR